MPKQPQPSLHSKKHANEMTTRRSQAASAPSASARVKPSAQPPLLQRPQATNGSSAPSKTTKATDGALKVEADSFLASLRLPPVGGGLQEPGAEDGAKAMHDKIELMRQQIAAKELAARGASPQKRTQQTPDSRLQTPASRSGKAAADSQAAAGTVGQVEKVTLEASEQKPHVDDHTVKSHVSSKQIETSRLPQSEKEATESPSTMLSPAGEEVSQEIRGQDTVAGVKRTAAQAAVSSIEDVSRKKMSGGDREPFAGQTGTIDGEKEVITDVMETSWHEDVIPQEAGVAQAHSMPSDPPGVLGREERSAQTSASEERLGASGSQGAQPSVPEKEVRDTNLTLNGFSRSMAPPSNPVIPAWASQANQLIQEGLETVRAGYAMAGSGQFEQNHMISGHPGTSFSLVPVICAPPFPMSWEEIQKEEDALEEALDAAQQRRRSLEVREALARRQLREATHALRAAEEECVALKRKSQGLAAARLTAEVQQEQQQQQQQHLLMRPIPLFEPPLLPLTLHQVASGDLSSLPQITPVQEHLSGNPKVRPLSDGMQSASEDFTFAPSPTKPDSSPLDKSAATSKVDTDNDGQMEAEDIPSPTLDPPTAPENAVSGLPLTPTTALVSARKDKPASKAAMIAERIRRGVLRKRSDAILSTHSVLSKSAQGGAKRSGGDAEEKGAEEAQLSKRRKSIRDRLMAQIKGQDASAVQNPAPLKELEPQQQAMEVEQPLAGGHSTVEAPTPTLPVTGVDGEGEAGAEVDSKELEAPDAAVAVPDAARAADAHAHAHAHAHAANAHDAPDAPDGAQKMSPESNGEEEAVEAEKPSQDVLEPSAVVLITKDEEAEAGGDECGISQGPPSQTIEAVLKSMPPETVTVEEVGRTEEAVGGGRWTPLVYTSPALHLLPRLTAVTTTPVTKNVLDADRDADISTSYRSPLSCLRATWRLCPRFATFSKASPDSLTWNNSVDPTRPLCKFELRGICNDDLCPGQHQKTYQLQAPTTPDKPHNPTDKKWWLTSSRNSKPARQNALLGDQPEVVYTIQGEVVRGGTWDTPSLQACIRKKVPQTLHTAGERRRLPRGCSVVGGRGGGAGIDAEQQEGGSGRYYTCREAKGEQGEGWEAFVEEALQITDFRLDSNVPLETRNKAIRTLVRFLEVSPKAPVPWALYLVLYQGAEEAQGASRSHIHGLCKTAVRYNGGSYELWSLYRSSGSGVEQTIGRTEEAIHGLITQSTEEKSVVSAQALALCLQLLQRCCVSGAAEKAVSWLANLLAMAEGKQAEPPHDHENTPHSAFLRSLLPRDHAILWITAAYLAAQHRLPPPVARSLGCHQAPLACVDLDWYGKDGPLPGSAETVIRIFRYASEGLGEGPSFREAHIALSVNEIQYMAVAQGPEKALAAGDRLAIRFGSSPEIRMLQMQCGGGVGEGGGEGGQELLAWVTVCQTLTGSGQNSTPKEAVGPSEERGGEIESIAGFWYAMCVGLEAALMGEEERGREASFRAFRWAMEGDSTTLQRIALCQLAGCIHRTGEAGARVESTVQVLTWLTSSSDRWKKFTGRTRPVGNLSRLPRNAQVAHCLADAFETTLGDPWMLNRLWGGGGVLPLDTPQLGLLDHLLDLLPANVAAVASCAKEQLPLGTSCWLAGLLVAALREEQRGAVAGSGVESWMEVERELREKLDQKEAADAVAQTQAALHCFWEAEEKGGQVREGEGGPTTAAAEGKVGQSGVSR